MNPEGRAGDRSRAGRHPPAPAAVIQPRHTPAAPSPGHLRDRSGRSRCHPRPPSGTPADGGPSAVLRVAAGRVCGRSAPAAATHYERFSNQTRKLLTH